MKPPIRQNRVSPARTGSSPSPTNHHMSPAKMEAPATRSRRAARKAPTPLAASLARATAPATLSDEPPHEPGEDGGVGDPGQAGVEEGPEFAGGVLGASHRPVEHVEQGEHGDDDRARVEKAARIEVQGTGDHTHCADESDDVG